MSALLQCCWLAAAARPARRCLCWPCSFPQSACAACSRPAVHPAWLPALAPCTSSPHRPPRIVLPSCLPAPLPSVLAACLPACRCHPSSTHQRAWSTLPARLPVLLAQLLTSACAAPSCASVHPARLPVRLPVLAQLLVQAYELVARRHGARLLAGPAPGALALLDEPLLVTPAAGGGVGWGGQPWAAGRCGCR